MTEMKQGVFRSGILSSAVADTNSALAHDPARDFDPIAETIRQYQTLVKFFRAHETEQVTGWNLPEKIRKEVTQKFDGLMGYMMQEFGSCPCTTKDVREVLSNQPLLLTTEHLESAVRGTIPVLVACNVIGPDKQNIPVQPLWITNWKSFAVAYSHKIL